MTQITDGDIFWVIGISGSILGIILNSYLIASLVSIWNRFPFACLFTATSVFDLMFSLVEILTQHVSFDGFHCLKNFKAIVILKGYQYFNFFIKS